VLTSCNAESDNQITGNVVASGKTITFNYAMGFDNGTLFDTSFEEAAKKAGIYDPNRKYEPGKVIIGKTSLFPGLLETLLGMEEDQLRNVRIPPEKAYGNKIENSLRTLDINNFDRPEDLFVTGIVLIRLDDKIDIPVYVREIRENEILVDLNHPLAGEFIQLSVHINKIE